MHNDITETKSNTFYDTMPPTIEDSVTPLHGLKNIGFKVTDFHGCSGVIPAVYNPPAIN